MRFFSAMTRLFKGTPARHDLAQFQEELLASLLVMAWVVEARDPYTGGHMWRVSRFSRLLAEAGGLLSPGEVSRIALGGFLHDLGKVAIPDAILRKPGKVTDEEYAVIKTHPAVGMRMLAGHPLEALARPAVLLHHETPDGRGYPFGLPAAQIPVDARIIGICDAFDAMTSTRPYRRGMPTEQALTIIETNLGRQFDQEYGGQMISLGRKGALEHIIGHSDDGIPLHECPMCGPTLVTRSELPVGELVYCPNCTGEFQSALKDERLVLQHTGRMGTPQNLETRPDTELIGRMVRGSARALLNTPILAA